jgi:hypothetical protein
MRGQYAGNAARTKAVDRADGFSEKEWSRRMPKRTKKLLVYLDQNFISEMAKADVNVRVKREWKDLFSLLKEGFVEEKLVVPQSWFHNVETSFAPVLKERIVSYQCYLGQVDLHRAPHVRINQTARFLQRFLGKSDQDPLETEIAFRDSPDRRVQQFKITANLNLSEWGFDVQRVETATTLGAIRRECIAKKERFEDHLAREFDAHREDFLKNALYYQHLCDDPRRDRDLIAFSNAAIFRTIPGVNISSRLWSRLLTTFSTCKIQNGDATDIEVLSTYLPYMDVIGTDAFMATQLASLKIDTVHPIKVEPGLTVEQILAICREHCKSDYFVLIEEYHPVRETFLVGAEMSAGAGVQMAEGCRIYAKKA